MATTTTNFGWDIPQSTDLVKDGATAIATLGQDIDTALVDLKGGTTGQVLSKNSNADLDFTWVAQDDSNAIQNAIVDAKGDLITATAADTPARLAVGTNGQYLQADSTAATGLKWATLSAGGMTEIASGNLSGVSTVRIQNIPGTYKALKCYVRNFKMTNTNATLAFAFNNDANSRYSSYSPLGQNSTDTFRYTSVYVLSDLSSTTNDGWSGIDIDDYANTTTWKSFFALGMGNDKTTTTTPRQGGIFGIYNQTGAITEFNIVSTGSNNFTAGTYILYGVN